MITVKYTYTVYVYFFILINISFQSNVLSAVMKANIHISLYFVFGIFFIYIYIYFSGKSTVQKCTFSQTQLIYLNIFPLKFALH